jgi:uridine kinase
MAIRTLLDHGVQQDHIVFVTFLIARTGGVTVLQRAFPKVKIVTGAVDEGLREAWLERYNEKGEGQSEGDGRKVWIIEPGMGQIGKTTYVITVCSLYEPFLQVTDTTSDFGILNLTLCRTLA